MSFPATSRTLPGRRSLRLALGLVVVLVAAQTGVQIALLPTDAGAPWWSLVAYTLAGPAYVAAGLVAWWRRPAGRLGLLMCLCGVALLASAIVAALRAGRLAATATDPDVAQEAAELAARHVQKPLLPTHPWQDPASADSRRANRPPRSRRLKPLVTAHGPVLAPDRSEACRFLGTHTLTRPRGACRRCRDDSKTTIFDRQNRECPTR